jgi:hypothetical protein
MQCLKCKSETQIHKHHVTYSPEYIIELCKSCHSMITSINTKYAMFHKRKLTNEERLYAHEHFIITDKLILEFLLKGMPNPFKNKNRQKKKKNKKKYAEVPKIIKTPKPESVHGFWRDYTDNETVIPDRKKPPIKVKRRVVKQD